MTLAAFILKYEGMALYSINGSLLCTEHDPVLLVNGT